MNKTVFSIGHSNIEFDDFVEKIKILNVKSIVDVRGVPKSSYVPHFNMENLKVKLPLLGFKYIYLGNFLGGKNVEDFNEHMKSETYYKGIKLLEEIIDSGKTVVMCSEKNVRNCHRQFICDRLIKDDYKVSYVDVTEKKKSQIQSSLI